MPKFNINKNSDNLFINLDIEANPSHNFPGSNVPIIINNNKGLDSSLLLLLLSMDHSNNSIKGYKDDTNNIVREDK